VAKNKKCAPPFVMIQKDLLKDPEWRKLSSSAKIVWIYLRKNFNSKTFQEVTLTYSEMKDMFSSRTMSTAIKELIKNGWIIKSHSGGLMGGVSKYTFNGKYKHFYYKGYKV